jgi:hypothetical protein
LSTYTVALGGSRMVGGELVAMPSVGQNLLALAGIGVNIQHLYDAQATGTFGSPAEEQIVAQLVEDAGSKAFVQFSVGLQYNYQRWGIYGMYRLMPQGNDFMITGEQHWFFGGVRFARVTGRGSFRIRARFFCSIPATARAETAKPNPAPQTSEAASSHGRSLFGDQRRR